jgi:hypothetical protein
MFVPAKLQNNLACTEISAGQIFVRSRHYTRARFAAGSAAVRP